ncbi:MAG TPA: hypothetical protein VGA96_15165 [Fibrella sp.]
MITNQFIDVPAIGGYVFFMGFDEKATVEGQRESNAFTINLALK